MRLWTSSFASVWLSKDRWLKPLCSSSPPLIFTQREWIFWPPSHIAKSSWLKSSSTSSGVGTGSCLSKRRSGRWAMASARSAAAVGDWVAARRPSFASVAAGLQVSTRQGIAGAAADSAERAAPGIELLLVRALEERIRRSSAGLGAVG